MGPAFTLIRDCRQLVDRLETLGRADALTPEVFLAIRRRLAGHFADLADIVTAARAHGANELALQALEQCGHIAVRVQDLHARGYLAPAFFEMALGYIRVGLVALHEWAKLDLPPTRLDREDRITGLPLCSARFVDRGIRHFAVIEGGLRS